MAGISTLAHQRDYRVQTQGILTAPCAAMDAARLWPLAGSCDAVNFELQCASASASRWVMDEMMAGDRSWATTDTPPLRSSRVRVLLVLGRGEAGSGTLSRHKGPFSIHLFVHLPSRGPCPPPRRLSAPLRVRKSSMGRRPAARFQSSFPPLKLPFPPYRLRVFLLPASFRASWTPRALAIHHAL